MTARKKPSEFVVPRAEHRLDEILSLHAEGKSDNQIAKALGFHESSIGLARRKAGLQPNGTTRRPLVLVGEGMAKCSRCDEVKSLEGWPRSRDGTGARYLLSFCRECRQRRLQQTINRSDESGIRDRWRRLVVRSRKGGIVCTIGFEDLLDQWREQAGACFYTGLPLDIRLGSGTNPNSVSIDKVEPSKGYVVNNVVFASKRVNTIKHDMTLDEMRRWTPDWYRRVMEMYRSRGIVCCQVAPGDF